MFRERPLTWLFIIATVCVDLVLVMISRSEGGAGAFLAIWSSIFLEIVIPTQLLLATTWVSIGNRRMCVQFFWLTVPIILACVIAYFCTARSSNYLSDYLKIYFTIVVSVSIAFVFYRRKKLFKSKRTLQFSTKTLLVWTTVIAIWIAGYTFTSKSSAELQTIFTLASVATLLAVVTVAVLNLQRSIWLQFSLLFAIVLAAAGLFVLLLEDMRSDDYWYLAGVSSFAELYLAGGLAIREFERSVSAQEREKALRATFPEG